MSLLLILTLTALMIFLLENFKRKKSYNSINMELYLLRASLWERIASSILNGIDVYFMRSRIYSKTCIVNTIKI
jgi:hypothetical protein